MQDFLVRAWFPVNCRLVEIGLCCVTLLGSVHAALSVNCKPDRYRAPYFLYDDTPGLVLHRCAAPRKSTLIRCGACVDPGLWFGTVTWHDRSLNAYVIRTHARYRWRVSRGSLFATRYGVFIDEPRGLFEFRLSRR